MASKYPILSREEVVRAVERQGRGPVPTFACTWWGEGLEAQYGPRLTDLAERYPDDVAMVQPPMPDWAHHPYSWRRGDTVEVRGHDAAATLTDWRYLDEFIETSPEVESLDWSAPVAHARAARDAGRYLLARFWRLFFEGPWGIRGMENLLLDYYDHPREVHRLHAYLRDTYIALYRRAHEEFAPDAIQSSDDLGNQRALNMTPGQFREFLKPYYAEVLREVHRLGMHLWFHSCGNNTDVMEDLVEVGVDVFHPVQKHTMDWGETARRYGGRMAWWAGFDVQHLLQEGTPDDIRAEVRHMVRVFRRPDGGLVLGAGNGITAGTPLDNIEAFLDETHRQR
jgi:uroporphyrinogen decarboxylase